MLLKRLYICHSCIGTLEIIKIQARISHIDIDKNPKIIRIIRCDCAARLTMTGLTARKASLTTGINGKVP